MSRKFQFSLRALLASMLVVAAFLGGILFERERTRPRREFNERIVRQLLADGALPQADAE